MKTKRTLALITLLATGAAVNAAPAPVTDLSEGGTDQRLEMLERMLEAKTNSQHRMQEQIDVVQQEVNELRGMLETQNYQLERILERQRELYLEIDKRIEAAMTRPAATTPSVTTTTVPDNAATDASGNEALAYERAVNLILKDKEYDKAIPEFQAFLSNFPNSGFAANAHYWLGQLLFNKQDWAGASEQFQVLVNNYSDSTKRADSIYKLGLVEQKRSNVARARQLFEQVMKEYPDSASSKMASNRLKELN